MSCARQLTEPLPLPGSGEQPIHSAPLQNERVVHFHLGLPADPQPSLVRVVRDMALPSNPGKGRAALEPDTGRYRFVDWKALGIDNARTALLRAAQDIRPTLVFMQVQRSNILDSDHLEELQRRCDPEGVVVWWSGDTANGNGLLAWPFWMPSLMQYLDLVLFANLTVPRAIQRAGFSQAGYLQVGFDREFFFPTPTRQPPEHDLVFFARRYLRKMGLAELGVPTDEDMRHEAMQRFYAVAGLRYLWGRATASVDTGEAYRRSRMALSISATSHYERYSSDRLFRILATGCVPVVKRFLGYEDLGLVHGKNCLLFDTLDEAEALVIEPPDLEPLSAGALALAQQHSWEQRMRELAPLVRFVREKRIR